MDYESLSPLSLPAGTADGWLLVRAGPPLRSEYRAMGRGNCALTQEVTYAALTPEVGSGGYNAVRGGLGCI